MSGPANRDGVPYFNEDGSANPAAGSMFDPAPPLIDIGQGPTLKKLSALGRYDTWAGAAQALVGTDPKGPGGAQYRGPTIPPGEASSFGTLGDHLDPGEPGDRSAHDSENGVMSDEMAFRRPQTSQAAKAFFEKEGYSKAPVGGEEVVQKGHSR